MLLAYSPIVVSPKCHFVKYGPQALSFRGQGVFDPWGNLPIMPSGQ